MLNGLPVTGLILLDAVVELIVDTNKAKSAALFGSIPKSLSLSADNAFIQVVLAIPSQSVIQSQF